MQGEGRDFLGVKLLGRETPAAECGYILSLIPYEETTTYKRGTAGAPEAIVEASHHIELFDEALGLDASRRGIATLRPRIDSLDSIKKHAAAMKREYPRSLHGFIGGEHSITPALIDGLCDGEMGIVWIDAHSDLRAEYMGRPDNHACAAHNCLEFGPIVQVGVRSLAEEEHELLEKLDSVERFREWGAEAERAIDALPRRVYLSFDVDGIDPALMRAVGTPEPGGLSWKDAVGIVEYVCAAKELLGFDVVELCPAPGDVTSDFTAARLVYKIMSLHASCARG
jgi:agmatinase